MRGWGVQRQGPPRQVTAEGQGQEGAPTARGTRLSPHPHGAHPGGSHPLPVSHPKPTCTQGTCPHLHRAHPQGSQPPAVSPGPPQAPGDICPFLSPQPGLSTPKCPPPPWPSARSHCNRLWHLRHPQCHLLTWVPVSGLDQSQAPPRTGGASLGQPGDTEGTASGTAPHPQLWGADNTPMQGWGARPLPHGDMWGSYQLPQAQLPPRACDKG